MKIKWLPLIVFVLLAGALWWGLYKDPHQINSPLINKTLPQFKAPSLMVENHKITNDDFLNHISLLNVFATWCLACREENLVLLEIAETHRISIYGLNYRDQRQNALAWLHAYGDPYQQIIYDPQGLVAIDLGVYGTPESFLIDKKGVIRYKHIGIVTSKIWQENLLPIIQKLEQE